MAHGQASFEYLGDVGVLDNVLKRLTAENLCKMSTLSSKWKDLLNDAHLINLHRAWSQKNSLLLLATKPPVQIYFTSDDSEVDPLLLTSVDPTDGAVIYQVRINHSGSSSVQVLSSGRGCLFCIINRQKNSVILDSTIFNATTKKIQTLPRAGLDPLISSVSAAGFGYIESRNAYAFFKLFVPSRSCQILMLSETGDIIAPWRSIGQTYSGLFRPGEFNGIMVRNKCYWTNRDIILAKFYRISPAKMSMLCLDIESEMFHEIHYPNFTYNEGVDIHLGDLKDQLYLGYSHGDPLAMDIWVLKDLQNSDWIIQYRVDLSLIGGIDDHGLSQVKLIGYWEGEQGGVLMFRDTQQQMLLYYNVEEMRFKKGKRMQVGNNVVDMLFPYSESFSSIRRPAR